VEDFIAVFAFTQGKDAYNELNPPDMIFLESCVLISISSNYFM